jgi:hypothetical protein
MSEVSMQEVSLQDADLLTTREALGWTSLPLHADVEAFNQAIAFAQHGDACAAAKQNVVVLQKG